MDRRSFLTGMFGLAGAAAIVTAVKPSMALAGMPSRPGILDELDKVDDAGGNTPDVEPVDYRDRRRHNDRHRPHRRRRRQEWRTVCRRYRRHGRWHRRCHRELVWVWR